VRDALEEQSALDPLEMEDLRLVNSEFTAPAFRFVMRHIMSQCSSEVSRGDEQQQYSSNCNLTYEEFIQATRQALALYIEQEQKQAVMAPTIEFGHVLDRVVLDVLHHRQQRSDEPQPLLWWGVVLSMAVHAPVPDRIQLLYELLAHTSSSSSSSDMIAAMDNDSSDNNNNNSSQDSPFAPITVHQVRELVGYLQDTCQLVPETQIVPTNQQYPTQQYARGKPIDLVHWEGEPHETVDVDALAAILRSKAVCVWGECYQKKKYA
jgi:hypothetical protein